MRDHVLKPSWLKIFQNKISHTVYYYLKFYFCAVSRSFFCLWAAFKVLECIFQYSFFFVMDFIIILIRDLPDALFETGIFVCS